jgi:hypothetical protein
MTGYARDRVRSARPNGPLQGPGLPAETGEVGTVGHVMGRHSGLLSYA